MAFLKGRVNHNRRIMTARWWALAIWAAVAATAVYWGLRVFSAGRPVPPQTQVVSSTANARGDLTRLFGVEVQPAAAAAPPPMAARFQLLGVAAPRGDGGTREGVALIAVDGKPARAYRVGAAIDGDNVLQSVRARGAAIGPRDGAALVSLDLPPPAPAATGTLPGVGAPGMPAPSPVARPPMPVQAPGMRPGMVTPPGLQGRPMSNPPTAPELAASAARAESGLQTQ